MIASEKAIRFAIRLSAYQNISSPKRSGIKAARRSSRATVRPILNLRGG
jgi:hypothetical protein